MSIPVPAILNEAVPATTQNVDAEIQASLRSANKYAGELSDNTFILYVGEVVFCSVLFGN